MEEVEPIRRTNEEPAPLMNSPAELEQPLPWKMIEPGRYQPRRIRGSCVGRELG